MGHVWSWLAGVVHLASAFTVPLCVNEYINSSTIAIYTLLQIKKKTLQCLKRMVLLLFVVSDQIIHRYLLASKWFMPIQ